MGEDVFVIDPKCRDHTAGQHGDMLYSLTEPGVPGGEKQKCWAPLASPSVSAAPCLPAGRPTVAPETATTKSASGKSRLQHRRT